MSAETIKLKDFAIYCGVNPRTVVKKFEVGKMSKKVFVYEDEPLGVNAELYFEAAKTEYERTLNKKLQLAYQKSARGYKNDNWKKDEVKNQERESDWDEEPPKKRGRPKKEKPPEPEPKPEPPKIKQPPPSMEPTEAELMHDRLAKARAESEENKARLQQLKIEEQEGRLVDKETVRATIVKLVRETRDGLLNIPDNLGPDLLACKDLLDLQMKLTQGINDALINLSRFGGESDEE